MTPVVDDHCTEFHSILFNGRARKFIDTFVVYLKFDGWRSTNFPSRISIWSLYMLVFIGVESGSNWSGRETWM